MSFDMVQALRTARLQLIADGIDAAATPGKLLLYSGTKPATSGGSIGASVLQATIVLGQPCADVALAVMTFDAGYEGARVAVDTITWGRFVDGDNNPVADANVTVVGGGGTIQVSNVDGLLGAIVRLVSGVIAE